MQQFVIFTSHKHVFNVKHLWLFLQGLIQRFKYEWFEWRTNLHLLDPGLWLAGGRGVFAVSASPLARSPSKTERRTSWTKKTQDSIVFTSRRCKIFPQKDIKRSDHQVSASITLKVTVTLTELPGEAGAALQRRVVEGVPAVHQAGGGQSLDGAQSQQVGVLQHRPPRSILDASLQGAKAAVLRVAEHFDALTLNQVVWEEKTRDTWDKRPAAVNQTRQTSARLSSVFLTVRFVFERLAALDADTVADLWRFVEAVGPAGRHLQAAAPTSRLPTRPLHQVLHPHHHLPGNRQNLILKPQNRFV